MLLIMEFCQNLFKDHVFYVLLNVLQTMFCPLVTKPNVISAT